MRYYLLIVTTKYEDMDFTSHIVLETRKELTQKQAEDYSEKMIIHPFTGEALYRVEINSITKKEYDIFKKYHI